MTTNMTPIGKSIVTTLGADDTSVPTSKAVKDVTDARFVTTDNVTLADGKCVVFQRTLGSDHTWSGVEAVRLTLESCAIFTTVAQCTSGALVIAGSSAPAAMPVVAMSTAAVNNGTSGMFLHHGYVRDDSFAFNLTSGVILYAGTSGNVIQAAPTTSGYTVQVVGYVVTSSTIYFDPTLTYMQLTG